MDKRGVHTIGDMYAPAIQAGVPDGRDVAAVAEPFYGDNFRAAWEVLCGRAFALRWPKAGELEDAFKRRRSHAGL